MIVFENVSVGYGGQKVLSEVSFQVNPGNRVGIVGPNGAGKTTIFALLTGELVADRGDITMPKDMTLGYLRQHLRPDTVEETVLDYAENALPPVRAIQHEVEALEEQLQSLEGGVERDRVLRRLGELQTDFENRGGYGLSVRAKEALGGLGFSAADLHKPFKAFSGGWQMRAELARALVARPDVLLLDEPTNFLDIPAVEWLQRFLESFKGTLLLVSHDRFLLNTLATVTLEVAGGQVTRYAGNYDSYAKERVLRHEQLLAAKANQDRKREQVERFIERFRAKNTKAAAVQSRVRMLDKMEEIAVPQGAMPKARIRVGKPPHCGVEVMRLEDAGMTYDGERWVLRHLDLSVARGEKTALVGLNGLGKTTLLRALAGRLPLSEGKRVLGHKVVVGYQAQDFAEMMDPEKTVYEIAKSAAPGGSEGEIRSLLGSFLFSGDAIEKTVSVLSGGEKMRLAFARLLFHPPNFLLLDEPTTHLDIASREMLENALQTYEGTVFIVSHDIEFTRRVATQIIAMTPPGVTRYHGGYDYYHEKMMKAQAVAQVAQQKAAEAAGEDEDKTPDRKELRRERAVKRQELSKRTKPLEVQVKDAEDRLVLLDREQANLVRLLSAPTPGFDFEATNKQLAQITAEMDRLTDRWERASYQLEQILKEVAAEEAEEA